MRVAVLAEILLLVLICPHTVEALAHRVVAVLRLVGLAEAVAPVLGVREPQVLLMVDVQVAVILAALIILLIWELAAAVVREMPNGVARELVVVLLTWVVVMVVVLFMAGQAVAEAVEQEFVFVLVGREA